MTHKNKTIKLKHLQNLQLEAASGAGRPKYLSAASGLIVIGDYMYIAADDEHHLGVFSSQENAPGRLKRLFSGELPLNHKKRKKKKPDLESLALTPYGLLAIPSGSKSNRVRGKLMRLNRDGSLGGRVKSFSFENHFELLNKTFRHLNIEGGACIGDSFFLGQRGNGQSNENAVIEFKLKSFFSPKPIIKSIHLIELGKQEGVALSFTDFSPLPDRRIVFSAAAEATESTYDDGECVGSVIGILDRKGKTIFQKEISKPLKIEGIHAEIKDKKIEILMVNDEDDIKKVAGLFRGVIPYGGE